MSTKKFEQKLKMNGADMNAQQVNNSADPTIATDLQTKAKTDADFVLMSRRGFENLTDSMESVSVGGLFSLTKTGSSFNVWFAGVKYTLAAGPYTKDISVLVDGFYVLYFNSAADASTGTITSNTVFPDLATKVMIAVVYKGPSGYLLSGQRHTINLNPFDHKSRHESIGARIDIGSFGMTVNAAAQINMPAAGGLWDEDLEFIVASGNPKQVLVFYRVAGTLQWTWTALQNTIWVLNGAQIRYDNAGTLTNIGNSNYTNYYIIATDIGLNGVGTLIVVMGQNIYTNINLARAANFSGMSVALLPNQEWQLLYKAIVHMTPAGVATFDELIDLRSSGSISTITGAYPNAAAVVFTPSGTVAATNVQGAIQELDDEKLALSGGIMTGQITLPNDSYIKGTKAGGGTENIIKLNAFDMAQIGAILDMGSQKIISMADPTNDQDAATKNYADLNDKPNIMQTWYVYASNPAITTNTYAGVYTFARNSGEGVDNFGHNIVVGKKTKLHIYLWYFWNGNQGNTMQVGCSAGKYNNDGTSNVTTNTNIANNPVNLAQANSGVIRRTEVLDISGGTAALTVTSGQMITINIYKKAGDYGMELKNCGLEFVPY